MLHYVECQNQEEYKELQTDHFGYGYEWWNGGSSIFDNPAHGVYPVYMVIDTASMAIGEIAPEDATQINFDAYSDYISGDDNDDDDYEDDGSLYDDPVQQPSSNIGAYIATQSGFSIFYAGKSYVVGNDHTNFSSIKTALQIGDYSCIESLCNTAIAINNFGKGNIAVIDGVVYYHGEQLHGAIVNTILKLIRDDFDTGPLDKFLYNLNCNPSKRAVDELYNFLEIGNLPITEDGCFLAYKKVRGDYKDIHSGTFDNSIGAVCSMPRNRVDDDSARTCSAGLHVCSYDYLKHFGNGSWDRVVICKINPRDVVSIPIDYNFTKMRVCEYTVIAEDFDYKEKNTLFNTSVYTYDDEYDDEYDEYDQE